MTEKTTEHRISTSMFPFGRALLISCAGILALLIAAVILHAHGVESLQFPFPEWRPLFDLVGFIIEPIGFAYIGWWWRGRRYHRGCSHG